MGVDAVDEAADDAINDADARAFCAFWTDLNCANCCNMTGQPHLKKDEQQQHEHATSPRFRADRKWSKNRGLVRIDSRVERGREEEGFETNR